MSIKDNIIKTRRYIRRNGLKKAVFAVAERLTAPDRTVFNYVPASAAELERQRKAYKQMEYKPLISLLVPAFNTKPEFLKALIDSVEAQTYENWELIIVDASTPDNDNVARVVVPLGGNGEKEPSPRDARIRYRKLERNQGISGNTNEALVMAKGEYTGLLDHDDLLTQDCLYHVAKAIEKNRDCVMVYTDEDKTDTSGTKFYEPNRKKSFDLDMLMTNNYICHFTVIKTDVMQRVKFRPEYDGAQDLDLFLRTSITCKPEQIIHMGKILYHWRCHEDSTASNIDSKTYAYDAGRAAVQDFCDKYGWDTEVTHTEHLGFYRVNYKPDMFLNREEVGAIGGPVTKNGRVIAGALKLNGHYIFTGMPLEYSGYMHRAKCQQQIYACDVRNMLVCPELTKEYLEAVNRVDNGEDPVIVSLEFANTVYESGRMIVYDPELRQEVK